MKTVFNKLSATIGGLEVALTEDTSGTGFTFEMPVLVHGNYLLKVTHQDSGYAKNDISMANILKITSISPNSGS